MNKIPISMNEIEYREGVKKYRVHSPGICYEENGELKVSSNAITSLVDQNDQEKEVTHKFTNCHQKVGITSSLLTGYPIGIKQNSIQYLEKPIALVQYYPETQTWDILENFTDNKPTFSYNKEINLINYGMVSSRVNLYYEKVYGNIRRVAEINTKGFNNYVGILAEVNTPSYSVETGLDITLDVIEKNGKIYTVEYAQVVGDKLRINYTSHSGTISSNETWTAGTHYISDVLTVNNGAILTIEAGAIVKVKVGIYYININHADSKIDINGTQDNPVIFTSAEDDSYGETITGSTNSPLAGDWHDIRVNNGSIEVDWCEFYYGETGLLSLANGGNITANNIKFKYHLDRCIYCNTTGAVINIKNIKVIDSPLIGGAIWMNTSSNNATLSLDGFFISSIKPKAIRIDETTMNSVSLKNGIIIGTVGNSSAIVSYSNTTYKNILIIGCYIGIDNVAGTGTASFLTITGADIGIRARTGGALTMTNSIVTGCDDGVVDLNSAGNFTSNHNCISGNFDNYDGVSQGANDINSNVRFVHNNFALYGENVIDGYFLNQTDSDCINAGSDTASNLGVDEFTTHPNGLADTGIADIGFHYFFPTSSTISINEGESTENDNINLTLSSTNADKMRFRINNNSWSSWESYSSSKQLSIASYNNQTLIIQAQFQNNEGSFSPIIFDSIFKGATGGGSSGGGVAKTQGRVAVRR